MEHCRGCARSGSKRQRPAPACNWTARPPPPPATAHHPTTALPWNNLHGAAAPALPPPPPGRGPWPPNARRRRAGEGRPLEGRGGAEGDCSRLASTSKMVYVLDRTVYSSSIFITTYWLFLRVPSGLGALDQRSHSTITVCQNGHPLPVCPQQSPAPSSGACKAVDYGAGPRLPHRHRPFRLLPAAAAAGGRCLGVTQLVAVLWRLFRPPPPAPPLAAIPFVAAAAATLPSVLPQPDTTRGRRPIYLPQAPPSGPRLLWILCGAVPPATPSQRGLRAQTASGGRLGHGGGAACPTPSALRARPLPRPWPLWPPRAVAEDPSRGHTPAGLALLRLHA